MESTPGSTSGKGFESGSLEYSEAIIAVHKGSSQSYAGLGIIKRNFLCRMKRIFGYFLMVMWVHI